MMGKAKENQGKCSAGLWIQWISQHRVSGDARAELLLLLAELLDPPPVPLSLYPAWHWSLGSGSCSHSVIFSFIFQKFTAIRREIRSLWEGIKTEALREYSLFKRNLFTLKKPLTLKNPNPDIALGTAFFPGSFYTPALGLCQVQTRNEQQNCNLDKGIPRCSCINTNQPSASEHFEVSVSINCIFLPAFHYFSHRKKNLVFFFDFSPAVEPRSFPIAAKSAQLGHTWAFFFFGFPAFLAEQFHVLHQQFCAVSWNLLIWSNSPVNK